MRSSIEPVSDFIFRVVVKAEAGRKASFCSQSAQVQLYIMSYPGCNISGTIVVSTNSLAPARQLQPIPGEVLPSDAYWTLTSLIPQARRRTGNGILSFSLSFFKLHSLSLLTFSSG